MTMMPIQLFILCFGTGLLYFGKAAGVHRVKTPSAYTDLFLALPCALTLLLVFISRKSRSLKAAGEPWDKSKR